MQKSLLIWAVLIGLFMTSASRSFGQATQPGQIVLARVNGDVTVTDKATAAVTKASNNLPIAQGSIVTTPKEGSVVLVFSNGATINLKGDSVLDIEQYLQDPFSGPFDPNAADEPSVSNTKLHLTRGELVGNVKHLNKAKNSSFSVQTPVGAAGIRGTTFRIVYRPSGNGTAFFSLTTSEGNVELATGTVTLPVAAAAGQTAKEVVLQVQVNDTTGAITVTTPAAAVVVVTAPAASVAAVVQAAAEVAQAVATVVFPATTPTPTPTPAPATPAPETKPEEKKPDPAPEKASSAPVPPVPTTTSGAGAT